MNPEQPRATRRTVLKSLALGAAACMVGELPAGANASQAGRGRRLPRTSAEAAGVQPAGILAFVDAVEEKVGGLHSFMLVRHGQVAAEGWWSPSMMSTRFGSLTSVTHEVRACSEYWIDWP